MSRRCSKCLNVLSTFFLNTSVRLKAFGGRFVDAIMQIGWLLEKTSKSGADIIDALK